MRRSRRRWSVVLVAVMAARASAQDVSAILQRQPRNPRVELAGPFSARDGGWAAVGEARLGTVPRRVLLVEVPARVDGPLIVSDTGRSDSALEVRLTGVAAAQATLVGDVLEYRGVYPDTDLGIVASDTAVTLFFVATGPSAPASFPMTIGGPGATTPVEDSLGVTWRAPDGSDRVRVIRHDSWIPFASSPRDGVRPTSTGIVALARDVSAPFPQVRAIVTFELAMFQRFNVPPARHTAALALDEARGRLVLFGGAGGGYLSQFALGDTLESDGTRWVERSFSVQPKARARAGLVWDAARGRLVLFGGDGSGNRFLAPLDDTWEYDGQDWTERSPAHRPPPRFGHGMAYDPLRQRVVVYGGWVSMQVRRSDTWEWDGADWTEVVTTPTPGERSSPGMAWDGTRGEVLLFGGEVDGGTSDETWSFDGTRWSRLSPPVSPPPRTTTAMAWDPWQRRVVVAGGCPTYAGRGGLSDAWAWDGGTWAPLLTLPNVVDMGALAPMPDGGLLLAGNVLDGETLERIDGAQVSLPWRAVPPPVPATYSPLHRRVVAFDPRVGLRQWADGFWRPVQNAPSLSTTAPSSFPSTAVVFDREANALFATFPVVTYGPQAVAWFDGGAWSSPVETNGDAWCHGYDARRGHVTAVGNIGRGVRALEWVKGKWVELADGGSYDSCVPDGDTGAYIFQGPRLSRWDPATQTTSILAAGPDAGMNPAAIAFVDPSRRVVMVSSVTSPGTWELGTKGWSRFLLPRGFDFRPVARDEARGVLVGLDYVPCQAFPPEVSCGGERATWEYAPGRTLSTVCTQDEQCASGFCADGVCCDSACGGGASNDCMACSAAAGAEKDGTCGPLTRGSAVSCGDPAPGCTDAPRCTPSSTDCPAAAECTLSPSPDPVGRGCACDQTSALSIAAAGAAVLSLRRRRPRPDAHG